jgi:F-type H+-transporting ATPase subunit gamma
VTRRRDIDRHLRGLGEIREILGAMRNLALLETHKLTRTLADQEQVVKTIRRAFAEVLAILPATAAEPGAYDEIMIVLGSERGFCGDFNRALLEQVQVVLGQGQVPIIVVGQRLAARLPRSVTPVASLAGATTTEEIADVIVRVMREVERWRESRDTDRPVRPAVLHQQRTSGVARTVLDPSSEVAGVPRVPGQPPRTYLAPQPLLEQLTEHYLYALLHQVFHGSLMAENERRMLHMENALRRLDEQSDDLRRRRNALRQEEITEEIEVITLTTSLRAG